MEEEDYDIPCLSWDDNTEPAKLQQSKRNLETENSSELCTSCQARHCEERFESVRRNLETITQDVKTLRYQLKIQPGTNARFCSEDCWMRFVYTHCYASTQWYAEALQKRVEALLQQPVLVAPMQSVCTLEEDGYKPICGNIKRTKQGATF